MKDLTERAVRGVLARVCAQAANVLLRVGSLAILARLLEPADFGLVGMVTAFTGVLNLFRDFGLSAASVQRARVTEEQKATLFWVNVLVVQYSPLQQQGLRPLSLGFITSPACT